MCLKLSHFASLHPTFQVEEMENKLTKLSGGVTLVSPEERKVVEDTFSEKFTQWRKRKRMFKDLWDTLTENSPKDPKEFKVLLPYLFELTLACLLN